MNISINISADTVLVCTAVVAAASLIASIYAICRDRVKLKVVVIPDCEKEDLLHMGFEAEVVSSIEGKRCVIKAINVGRRPISLQPKPEYKYDGETATDVSGWRPESDLVEGKSAAVIINKAIDLSKLTDVVVKDVTGRSRKGKIPKTKE